MTPSYARVIEMPQWGMKSKLKKPKQVVVSMNQMKKSLFCILFLVTSAILNTCTAEPTSPIHPENLFEEHAVSVQEDSEDISFRYRLLKPETSDSNKKFPLVIFFHGAGERGSDNARQLKYFPTWMTSDPLRKKYPCFILAPQCREGYRWSAVDMTTDMQAAMKALDHVIETEAVDTDQILITGLSMGGAAAWEVAMRLPERIAAAVPVCGKSEEKYAELAKDVPLWVVHGDADTVIPVDCSRSMVAAVKEAGGNPKYTELPGVGHDSWTAAYHDEKLLDWFFKQHR